MTQLCLFPLFMVPSCISSDRLRCGWCAFVSMFSWEKAGADREAMFAEELEQTRQQVRLFVSLAVWLSVCVCVCVCVSISLSLFLCLSVSLYIIPCLFLFTSISASISLLQLLRSILPSECFGVTPVPQQHFTLFILVSLLGLLFQLFHVQHLSQEREHLHSAEMQTLQSGLSILKRVRAPILCVVPAPAPDHLRPSMLLHFSILVCPSLPLSAC